jgi:hypothetical protein
MDGILMNFHGELRWVQLRFFGMDEMDSDVWKVDKIDSSSGQRVTHFQGMATYMVFD